MNQGTSTRPGAWGINNTRGSAMTRRRLQGGGHLEACCRAKDPADDPRPEEPRERRPEHLCDEAVLERSGSQAGARARPQRGARNSG